MIDYAKNDVPQRHRERLLVLLNFERPVNEDTGAINESKPRTAKALGTSSSRTPGLNFHLLPSKVILLDGSWHKHGQGGTNYGRFTLGMFRTVVDQVCTPIGIAPSTLGLQVLEAGLNLRVPGKAKDILKRLICHREGVPFTTMPSKSGRSLGLVVDRSDYQVKVYDKGSQYGLAHEELRFEVKWRKSRQLRAMGIRTVADLLHPRNWERLTEALLRVLDDLIIEEPDIPKRSLTPSQAAFVAHVGDHRYWRGLTAKQRHRARVRYDGIVQACVPIPLKARIRALIVEEAAVLRSDEAPLPLYASGDVLTPLSHTERGDVLTSDIGYSLTHSNNGGECPAREGSHPSVMGEIIPKAHQQEVRCVHCNRDISHQRAGSKLCSRRKRGGVASRCQNAYFNERRDLKKLRAQSKLFDDEPFMRLWSTPDRRREDHSE